MATVFYDSLTTDFNAVSNKSSTRHLDIIRISSEKSNGLFFIAAAAAKRNPVRLKILISGDEKGITFPTMANNAQTMAKAKLTPDIFEGIMEWRIVNDELFQLGDRLHFLLLVEERVIKVTQAFSIFHWKDPTSSIVIAQQNVRFNKIKSK